MIVRFVLDNYQYYDYQERTAGYLDVPSLMWLYNQYDNYRDAIRNLLKKYGLYSDDSESEVTRSSVVGMISSLQFFIEDENNRPSDPKDRAIFIVKGIYFLMELTDLTFYSFVKSLPEAQEVEVTELDSQGINETTDENLCDDLYEDFESLGLDIEKINNIANIRYKDMLKYV